MEDIVMKWVPVTERLPVLPDPVETWQSNRVEVVVSYEGYNGTQVTSMDYVKEFSRGKIVTRFKWNRQISTWKVIAWMPLPEPYKAG